MRNGFSQEDPVTSTGKPETYDQAVRRWDAEIGRLQQGSRGTPRAKRFAAMRRLLDARNAELTAMFGQEDR